MFPRRVTELPYSLNPSCWGGLRCERSPPAYVARDEEGRNTHGPDSCKQELYNL